jgi:hypothetical protein
MPTVEHETGTAAAIRANWKAQRRAMIDGTKTHSVPCSLMASR